MSILIGAIAYRASTQNEVEKQISLWQMTGSDYEGIRLEQVVCPRCSEPYVLIEGKDASDELLQKDVQFLAKALSTGHPYHPVGMVIRDPSGSLTRNFSLPIASASQEPLHGNCQPKVKISLFAS